MGKTAFALSVLHNLAIRQEVKVGLFSMEMSIIELANRWISMEASILHESIHMGRLGDADLRKIAAHEKNILSAPVFIDETASLSILELSTRARRMCAKEGVKLIIVDYLQLMQGDVRKGRDSEYGGTDFGYFSSVKESCQVVANSHHCAFSIKS